MVLPVPSSHVMRVLVLGGTGKIGRLLKRYWRIDKTLRVTWHGRRDVAGPETISCDLLGDTQMLSSYCADADVILHLAGSVPQVNGPEDACLANMAEVSMGLASHAGCPILIASSAAVYAPAEHKLSEGAPKGPVSDYGRAKLRMEQHIDALRPSLDIPVTVLRIGNVAGADSLLAGLRSGVPCRLDQFPDGTTPRRSYIGPRTLSDVIKALLVRSVTRLNLPNTLNLAAPGAVQMHELLDAAEKPWIARPAGLAAIRNLELDVGALLELLPMDAALGTPGRLVAEWRESQTSP